MGLRFIPAIFYDITEDEALQRMADSAALRRNLKPGQRAAILLEFTELVEKIREEARARQLAGLKKGEEFPVSPDLDRRENTMSTKEILAEKAGIGKSSMAMLQAVQRDEPGIRVTRVTLI